MKTKIHKWFRADPARGIKDDPEVDFNDGVIPGVAIVSVGEAEGHNISLDEEFINNVAMLGNEKKHGVKARFGHPAMSSDALGTFIGRFKSFRVDGGIARADLHLSETAGARNPNGDIRQYVIDMALDEPDMFGTSIVFTPGSTYRRNGDGEKVYEGDDGYNNIVAPDYIDINALHAADVVDEPAANNGMFSEYSISTFAGRIVEFLNKNPDVYELLDQHPEIIEPFLKRYQPIKHEELKMENSATDAKAEIRKMINAFGAEFAMSAIEKDLSFDQAREVYIDIIRQENIDFATKTEQLEKKIVELEKSIENLKQLNDSVTDPVSSTPVDDSGKSEFRIRTEKYVNKIGQRLGSFAGGIKLPK